MCSPYEVSLSEMPLLRSLTGQGRRPNLLVVCSDRDVPAAFEWVRDLLGPPLQRVCPTRSARFAGQREGDAVPSRYRRSDPASANHAVRLAEHQGERGAGGVDDRVADAAACRDRPIPRRLVLPAEHHLDRRGERLTSAESDELQLAPHLTRRASLTGELRLNSGGRQGIWPPAGGVPRIRGRGEANGEEMMRFRHLMSMVAVGLGSAACSVNPVGPTAGSLSVPAVSAISIDTPTLVRTAPVEATIVRNPAPEPPAPVVAPKPPVTSPPPPAAVATPAPVVPTAPTPTPALAPPPAAPTAPADGPCGATPCAPPVTTTCPAGTVPTLRDVVTCEPPVPPTTCPPGMHPVLRDVVTCEK